MSYYWNGLSSLLLRSLTFVITVECIAATAYGESYSQIKNQFAQVGSIKVAYRQYGKKSAVPVVLLMHTRGNMDNWDPELLDVLAEDRTVITFDTQGTGLTDGIAQDNFAAMADDAAGFIKSLKYQKVDLLGFSIGGAVAQEVLIRHNKLVRKVIIAGSSAKGGLGVNDMSERSRAVSVKPVLTDDDLLYAFFAQTPASQALGRNYLQRIKRRKIDGDKIVTLETAKAQATARAAWGAEQLVPDERLKNVRNAILITNGKDDIRMPTINSYNLFKIAPNAQLILYPDSGHGFLFQYPQLVGANFNQFLNQTELDDKLNR